MSELAGKTAFVTGATGFLGGVLVRRLAAEGVYVRALARRANRDRFIAGLENVDIYSGDMTDTKRLHEITTGCDYVFHVAATLGGSVAKLRPVNVEGTRSLMEAAESAGVKRVVHVSSIAIYGFPSQGIITEDKPPLPNRVPYNITKLEGEQALIGAAKNVPYSIIRPGMIYGANSVMWTRNMFNLAKRRPTLFVGDGSGSTHPVYVDDVVDMMVTLATHPRAAGEAFNCAPDPSPTWREYLGAYAKLAGHDRWLALPVPLVKLIVPLAEGVLTLRGEPQDIPKIIPYITGQITYSMQKARDYLNWQPKVSLEEGIQRCVPYLREKGLLA
jgi:nucleoside-diphosphate-sugar epimerase